MDEGHEGEEFSKRRAQEELEASCHMARLGGASATSVPNELQVGQHGQPSHGSCRRERCPVAGEQEEGGNHHGAVK